MLICVLLADGYFMMFCRFCGGLFYLKDDRGIFVDSEETCFTQFLGQNRLLNTQTILRNLLE